MKKRKEKFITNETGEPTDAEVPEEETRKERSPFKDLLQQMEKQYIVGYSHGFGFSIDLGTKTWEPAPYVDDPNEKPFDYKASMQVYVIESQAEPKQWVIMGIKQCDFPKGALRDITEIIGVTNQKPTTAELKKILESSIYIPDKVKANLDQILSRVGISAKEIVKE